MGPYGKATRGRRWAGVVAGVVAGVCVVGAVYGQNKPGASNGPATPMEKGAAHADTTYVRELLRLQQGSLLKLAASNAKGQPGEWVFEAGALMAGWDEARKSRSKLQEATGQYLEDIRKYLESQPTGVDGAWALDQAKFIIGVVSEPVVNRMEYWANSAADRAKLAPMAALAGQLLKLADVRLKATLAVAENGKQFNEELYMKTYAVAGEVEYYRPFGLYEQALALEAKDAPRQVLLGQVIDQLTPYATDESMGVKPQALLLRGKAYLEAGKTAEALKDLQEAAGEGAPDWVQYQAHYQVVVAKIKGRDYGGARQDLKKFKEWISSQPGTANPSATVSADMLGYRMAWAEAESTPAGADREQAKLGALKILAGIIDKEPRFRELVFEQLAAQVADSEDLTKLQPMQALAVAWSRAQGATAADGTETEAGKEGLRAAVKAALAVRDNKEASKAERLEATLIAGVCATRLGQWLEAAKLNLDFAEQAPNDPRAKAMVEAALGLLGDLRTADRKVGGGTISPEVAALTQRALDLATGKYGQTQWLFAQAVTLEDQGKLQEAALTFEKVRTDDPKYLDARYRLVRISVTRLGQLTNSKAQMSEQQQAGRELLRQCDTYLKLLAGAPAEAREQAKTYMLDLRLIQVATALNPLQDWQAALKNLQTLEEEAAKNNLPITPVMQGAVLRYRILAYQIGNKSDEAMQELAKLPAKERPAIIKGMVYKNVEEIDAAEKADPARAQQLASTVVDLLGDLIKTARSASQEKDAYEYEQLKAEMLARAGKGKDAKELWLKLQKDQPQDLRNRMGEARAAYQTQDYKVAHELFIKLLPSLPLEGESYWESYLRIIQCNEALSQNTEDTKRVLRDLKASYGVGNMGGKQYKQDYERLVQKYGI